MPNAKKERARKKKQVRGGGGGGGGGHRVTPALAASAARIEAANAIADLSVGLEPFLAVDLPAPAVSEAAPSPVLMEIRDYPALAAGEVQEMYDLLKDNMRDMYMEAGWGWNPAEKRREMEHRHARFLIARWADALGDTGAGSGDSQDGGAAEKGGACASQERQGGDEGSSSGVEASSAPTSAAGEGKGGEVSRSERACRLEGKPSAGAEGRGSDERPGGQRCPGRGLAGYCHFRFAWDEDENDDGEGVGGKEDVLYIYELQVAPSATRRGLGRRMMQVLELLANRHGMGKVMLTVLKNNQRAMRFYTEKMRYVIDKDSPSRWGQPDAVYEILSKPTRHGVARAKESQPASLQQLIQ